MSDPITQADIATVLEALAKIGMASDDEFNTFHRITAAIARERALAKEMVEALGYYANEDNWRGQPTPTGFIYEAQICDRGAKARNALSRAKDEGLL